MALNLVANLTLRTRNFLTGLTTSQNAAARFSRFLGSQFASGAAAQAGAFATQSVLDRVFGGAKRAAGNTPAGLDAAALKAVTGGANLVQPVVDPLGLKRKMLLALGAATAAGSFIAKKGIDEIAAIKDLSEQSDEATTTVQRLTNAAKASGLEFSHFHQALSAGAGSRKDALESSKEMRERFAALGVTLKDLQDPGKGTLDLMQQIVATAKDVHSENFRAAFRDLFGRGSDKLIAPLVALNQATGPIISPVAIDAVDRLSKGFEKTGRAIRSAFGELTGRVVDAFFRKIDDKSTLVGALAHAAGVIGRVAGRKVGSGFGLFDEGLEFPPEFVGPLRRGDFRPHDLEGGAPFEDVLGLKTAQEEAEKVKRLNEQIHQEQLRGMNTEQRRLALQRDLFAVQMELDSLQFDTKESERKELELKEAQIKTDLKLLSGGPLDVPEGGSLAKVGTFATGGEHAVRGLLERVAKASEMTAENTKDGMTGEVF